MAESFTGGSDGGKIKKKSFKENLRDIRKFRKNQWEDLSTPDGPYAEDLIDEGFGGIMRITQKIAVCVEVVLYNSLFKAVYDTYVKRKK